MALVMSVIKFHATCGWSMMWLANRPPATRIASRRISGIRDTKQVADEACQRARARCEQQELAVRHQPADRDDQAEADSHLDDELPDEPRGVCRGA